MLARPMAPFWAAFIAVMVPSSGAFAQGTPVFVTEWGSHGSAPGLFDSPRGIAIGAGGEIFVADLYNNRIQAFDANGVFARSWGTHGFDDGQFHGPVSVAQAPNGNLYVLDLTTAGGRIQEFTVEGQFLSRVPQGSGYHFLSPNCLAVAPDGSLWVASQGLNQLVHIAPDGRLLAIASTWQSPDCIAVDSHGIVFAILNGQDIARYAPDGTGLGSFASWLLGSPGRPPIWASSLAIDPDDNLIVGGSPF